MENMNLGVHVDRPSSKDHGYCPAAGIWAADLTLPEHKHLGAAETTTTIISVKVGFESGVLHTGGEMYKGLSWTPWSELLYTTQ